MPKGLYPCSLPILCHRRGVGLTATILAAAIMGCSDTNAPPSDPPLGCLSDYRQQINIVSQAKMPVWVAGFDLEGDTFVGLGSGSLIVVDTTVPAELKVLGSVPTPNSLIGRVWLRSQTAFVPEASGLIVVDVSSPSLPKIADRIGLPGWPYSVATHGSHVYVLTGTSIGTSILVWDFSDPYNLRLMGSIPMPEFVSVMGIHEGLLVVGDFGPTRDIHVYDIRSEPIGMKIGEVSVGGIVTGLHSSQDIFLVRQHHLTQELDLSDPSNPRIRRQVELPFASTHAAVQGNYLYVSGRTELVAIDTRGSSWSISALFKDSFNVHGFRTSPDALFSMSGNDLLATIDIRNNRNVVPTGVTDVSGIDVDVQGGHAFLAVGASVTVMDLTNPRFPTTVGQTDSLQETHNLRVDGKYAYVAGGKSGLRVLDVSDLRRPTVLSSIGLDGFCRRIALYDSIAYVNAGYVSTRHGIHVVNVSNPSDPKFIRTLELPGFTPTVDLVVHGNYAFAFLGRRGTVVLDLADPEAPKTHTDWPSSATSTYVGTFYDGHFFSFESLTMSVWEVSDILNPEKVKEIAVPYIPQMVRVHDGIAFAQVNNKGVMAIDLRDATSPEVLGLTPTVGGTSRMAVSESGLAVAGDYFQLVPFHCSQED